MPNEPHEQRRTDSPTRGALPTRLNEDAILNRVRYMFGPFRARMNGQRSADPHCSARTTGNSRRRGLTLIELLVVLAILAVLATVAVTSADALLGQGRYEATQRTLEEIRAAVVDDRGETGGGKLAVSGFVADTGRLPAGLDELLQQPAGMELHAVQPFDSDGDGTNDISLATGWRGPYLRLAPGRDILRDGWGQTLSFVSASGVLTIASLGADGNSDLPEDGYDRDVQVRIEPADYSTALVTFHVRALDMSGNEVDPSLAGDEDIILRWYAVDTATGQAVLTPIPVNETTFQYTVPNAVVAGAFAVRAVVIAGSNIKKKSAPSYVTVRPRSSLYQKLIVR